MTRPIPPARLSRLEGERLPWLDDVPSRRPGRRRHGITGSIAALLLIVAGASYWAGQRSGAPIEPPEGEISASLPDVRSGIEVSPGTPMLPPQEAASSTALQPIERPGELWPLARPKTTSAKVAPLDTQQQSHAAGDRYPLWSSGRIEGAEGKMVRIGAFETRSAAEDGWKKILVEYPGMARLSPIVVSGTSLRDGRVFYSIQLGTSSLAHSQVVCERSSGLDLKCSVVGPIVESK